MGDFNADLGNSLHPPGEQGRILQKYLQRWSYVSTHVALSHGPLHNYESDAHHTYSTIDHIVCPAFFLPSVLQSHVLTDHPLNLSDHLPGHAAIQVPCALLLQLVCRSPVTTHSWLGLN